MVPSHAPAGVVWNVNCLPTTGSNPVGAIIQRPIRSLFVSVFQIVSGACGKTWSTMIFCVSGFSAASFIDRFLRERLRMEKETRGRPGSPARHCSALAVLVVAAPPDARLVAALGRAIEPGVHAPDAVHAARVGRVGVVDGAVL